MPVLALAYLDYAKGYCSEREEQRESTEYANLRLAIEPVSELHALVPFDPMVSTQLGGIGIR